MKASEFNKRKGRIRECERFGRHYKRKAMRALMKWAGAIPIIFGGQVVAHRMRDGSVVCRWQRYKGHSLAQRELANIHATTTIRRIPVRAYRCPLCEGWHLTAKE